MRDRYAVPRTSLQSVGTRRRNCRIGQLSPFAEYAPQAGRFPVWNFATIKLTHHSRAAATQLMDLASWLGSLRRLGGFVICFSLPRHRALSNPLDCVMLGNEALDYFRFAIGP
jgi:hypothetical protein